MRQPQQITIVGGGLVGALAAIVLARRNHRVTIYERRPDMRTSAVPAGRSINLAVSARGLLALEQVGLKQAVLDISIAMAGRMVHTRQGETTFIPYGQRPEEVIYSVSRGALNQLLLQHAMALPNVSVHFQHRCLAYDPDNARLEFDDEIRGNRITVHAGTVIASDGSASAVRSALRQQVPGFDATEEMLDYGYKELAIPAASGGSFALDRNALHIWPRESYMLIALPNLDGSFTCTLFLPFTGEVSFAALESSEQAVEFFRRNFADAESVMPALAHDFAANRTSSMVTLRCSPWHVGGRATLLGDAAHAIVPFFGQGMNCGFEDCTALGRLLDRGLSGWENLFNDLEQERKPNADAIADLALENFVEMRDTVADPAFQFKKQIGFELERRHPRQFIPRYSMVVFHPEISYAEARRRGIAQDILLERLAAGIDSLDHVDWGLAEQLLRAM